MSRQLADLLTQVGGSGGLRRLRLEDGLSVSMYVREGRVCVLLSRNHWEPRRDEGVTVARELGWKEYELERTPIPKAVAGWLLREKVGAPKLLPGARLALADSVLSVRHTGFSEDDWEIRTRYLRGCPDDELLEEYRWYRKRVAATPDPLLRAEREASLLTDEQLSLWGLLALAEH